ATAAHRLYAEYGKEIGGHALFSEFLGAVAIDEYRARFPQTGHAGKNVVLRLPVQVIARRRNAAMDTTMRVRFPDHDQLRGISVGERPHQQIIRDGEYS